MNARFALVLHLALLGGAAHAATVTRYDIYAESGHLAGAQVVERGDDGVTRVQFSYQDNGRGPELTERIRYAPDGTPSQYDVEGHSTFGAHVDEHFTRQEGQAAWHSTSEQGHQAVSGPALYLPLNGSYQFASDSIAALAAHPGAPLPLLPAGALTQERLDRIDVAGPDGRHQSIELVAQTGVGLSPTFLWATSGPQPRLFGVIEPGRLALVEQGWQGALAPMRAHQKEAETRLLAALAARLQHRLDGLTVVRNARVFDSERAQLLPLSDVYVLRGRITAVLPAGSPAHGARHELDAAGRVLLPGLFDMHAHVSRWEGGLNLAAGVTSVRDMGNDNAELQLMLDETAQGHLLQPQIVPAGFLEGDSPFAAQNGFVIRTRAEAYHAVDWYAEHGYPQLKIYNSFPKALLKDTVAYAHGRGMRVSGHIPAGLRADEALDAGYDEIQHINQLMLNFLVTPQTDTRTLARFTLPAAKVADLDFRSAPVRSFIARLRRRQTVIDQTLATFAFLKQKDGDMNTPYAPIAAHMPPDVQRGFRVGTMHIPDAATLHRYERSYDKMRQFVGLLYRAGVPLVAGTDDLAGFTLQAELELLVQAGLTPAQALQVATRNGARYTRTSAERGSVTPGKLADLVLVDGDPTRTMADVRKVAAVITRGYLLYPREIDAALGIVPFVDGAPVLRAVADDAPAAAR